MVQNIPPAFTKANIEYQSGNYRKARLLFRQALDANPQSIEAQAGLIITLSRFLEFKEVEERLG
jgi:thioredoxin-like negative regulator of GroEL